MQFTEWGAISFRAGGKIFGQPRNLQNLASYWFLTVILLFKANNSWGSPHVTHKLGVWLIIYVCGQMDMKPTLCWQPWSSTRCAPGINSVLNFVIWDVCGMSNTYFNHHLHLHFWTPIAFTVFTYCNMYVDISINV